MCFVFSESRKDGEEVGQKVAQEVGEAVGEKVAQKVAQEATEAVMAAKDARSSNLAAEQQKLLVAEMADLWFHCLIALSQFNLRPEDVIAELDRRLGTSGIEEKAARKASGKE